MVHGRRIGCDWPIGFNLPHEITGEISTGVDWFNDGYSFSQVCENQAVLETNAQAYYSYFSANDPSQFGKEKLVALSLDDNATYYQIIPATMEECYSTNPSARYMFYYVRDTELEDRYLKQDAAWFFDIRYETVDGVYKLKIFVENAALSRSKPVSISSTYNPKKKRWTLFEERRFFLYLLAGEREAKACFLDTGECIRISLVSP